MFIVLIHFLGKKKELKEILLVFVNKLISLNELFFQKASRQLKNSLEKLHRRLYQEEFNVITLRKNMDFMPLDIDYDIQRKKRMLEVNVQDAFLR